MKSLLQYLSDLEEENRQYSNSDIDFHAGRASMAKDIMWYLAFQRHYSLEDFETLDIVSIMEIKNWDPKFVKDENYGAVKVQWAEKLVFNTEFDDAAWIRIKTLELLKDCGLNMEDYENRAFDDVCLAELNMKLFEGLEKLRDILRFESTEEVFRFYMEGKMNKNWINLEFASSDMKFKVGEIYKNPVHGCYWLCTWIVKDPDGSIHYGGRCSVLEKPSMLESNLGLANEGNFYDFGDDIHIEYDHIYNLTERKGEFELMRDGEVEQMELVKKVSYDTMLSFRRAEKVWEEENKES